jgi:hypothetical protein
VQYGQPNHALWFLLQPAQEVHGFYLVFVLASFLEATTHAGLDVRASERRDFAQLSRYLYAVMQQKSQFTLIHQSIRIRDQTEQI